MTKTRNENANEEGGPIEAALGEEASRLDVAVEVGERAPRPRGPVRTCVGCAKQDTPKGLLRVVLGPVDDSTGSPAFAIDLTGGSAGRGAHVHAVADCVAKACRGGFARSFRTKISWSPADIVAQLDALCVRRLEGLVSGACRGQHVAVGADAVKEALQDGSCLVLVAGDAGSIAQADAIRTAVAAGNALAFANKAILGGLTGRDEVAVLAVLSERIAHEIKRVYSLADAVRGSRTGRLGV